MVNENLVKQAIRRETGALEALYDQFAPKFLAVCMRYCGNQEDAEDVLHDGFIKIIQNIHKFRIQETGSLEAWMKRIVVNTALNFLRDRLKENRNVSLDPQIERFNIEERDEQDFPEPFLHLDKDQILKMICDLPLGYRTVFNMYVFENYGHKEIALQLGFTENTSKSQLSKARALLRKKIFQLTPEVTP